jgi:hypothetical protein
MGKGAPPLPEMFSRDQLFKPFLVMGIMYVVKQYVDAENEDHIQMIRIAFGVQLVGCFLIHLVIGPMVSFDLCTLDLSNAFLLDRETGRR